MTIAEATDELIGKSPFLEEALSEGLINISSLARKIKPDIESLLNKPVQEGAIVMAINRRPVQQSVRISKQIKAFMRNLGDVIVRSNLSDYTFENSSSLISCHQKLMQEAAGEKDILFTVSQGVYETTLVVSHSLDERIRTIFEKEKMISRKKSLSSVTLRLPESNTEISGIYYFLLKNLAWGGINICEVISTSNEVTFVVNEQDVHKAFSIFMEMKHP
jgi:hypothetical protein